MSITPAIRSFIKKYKNNIKNYALFSTAGDVNEKSILKSVENLIGKKTIISTGLLTRDLKNKI